MKLFVYFVFALLCFALLLTAWTQSLAAYQHFVFRRCSLASHDYLFSHTADLAEAVPPEGQEECLDAARNKIIFDATKAITNLLSESIVMLMFCFSLTVLIFSLIQARAVCVAEPWPCRPACKGGV